MALKITILDGYTLNPGDIDWGPVEALGELTVYERTPPELIESRAKDADVVLTNKTPLREEVLARLPKLKYIGVLATGYDVVDVKAAANRGIPVTNIPAYGTDSVAQYVFALILELCHHVGAHSQSVKRGDWAASADFCYWHTPLVELAGKTLGIVGMGRIGQRTAQIASAYGMKVIAYSGHMDQNPPLPEMEWSGLNELLERSDVVSLHCPLTPGTEGLINGAALARMKPTAFLINTSRGKLIVDQDVTDALNEGRLAGAALDVLTTEPPAAESPLITASNCIVTPHIAWASQEARSRLMNTAASNVQAFLDGSPVNVVNGISAG